MALSRYLPAQDSFDETTLSKDNLLLIGILRGGKCVGHENIDVDDTAAVSLTIPGTASFALITIEADGTAATPSKCVRWYMDGNSPTAADGMPLGDLGTLEIKNASDLANFEIIGIEVGKTHKMRVAYYA